jgi:hypothetical protein
MPAKEHEKLEEGKKSIVNPAQNGSGLTFLIVIQVIQI